MKEVWKLIEYKDVPPVYQVSNKGRVRRIEHMTETRNQFGVHKITRKEKLMSFCKNTNGYYMFRPQMDNKKGVHLVHRLVATAFIPNPEGKPCVNHRDSDRANNCVENLEWCTQQENSAHAASQGRMNSLKGEASNLSKLTEEEVSAIYKMCKGGKSQIQVSKLLGIPRPTIASIMQKVSWKHLTDKIDEVH